MMVDFGEAQVFERQMAHAVHGGVDIDGAFADLV